ncbi:glycerate kinase [Tessaracoccus sp. OS52]|uniref:glycerate kinase n=1 Tax=Tessaracoccus sp. OS52 TaxID=2886691 RepID=UPI001D1180C2|nr:glycerate kinase [Tessaracoccus sp. OS52]MCC2593443.1 glycerate kinase [Tessaracoccus sp. OS52]
MRVLIACDEIAGLGPRSASELIGTAFAQTGAEVAVIPLGHGGDALADALSTLEERAQLVRPADLESALVSLVPGPDPLWLDLSQWEAPSLAELTAVLSPEVVGRVRGGLSGREVVAVVPHAGALAPLTGLSGALAELGRDRGADLAETLADDARAEAWAKAIGADPMADGSGALGGVGAAVIALGGRVGSGLELCLAGYDAARVMGAADVVVTATAQLDFHAVGGPVVKRLSELAALALRPLVVIAGRTFVSARELRLAGVEAAYAVLPGAGDEEPTPADLAATAAKVASTWRW